MTIKKLMTDLYWALCVLGLVMTFYPKPLVQIAGFLICGLAIYKGYPRIRGNV